MSTFSPFVLGVVLLELLAIATIGAVDDPVVLNDKTGGVLSYDNFESVGLTEFLCIYLECWKRE